MRLKLNNLIPILIAAPSVVIGVLAMYNSDVPTFFWAQNIACFLLLGVISLVVIHRKSHRENQKVYYWLTMITVVLIILTLINKGMDGVHRWISIGGLRFNVAMIVLPGLILLLWKLFQSVPEWIVMITTLVILVVLAIQPDASQLTAFAVPMMIMLYSKMDNKLLRLVIVGVSSVFIVYSWMNLDSLEPVNYVEGIVGLLKNMGMCWIVLGVISLIILPLPFLLSAPKRDELASVCVGMYFIITLVSTCFGNFPVPLMGYGISPIIGYMIAITWYAKEKVNS